MLREYTGKHACPDCVTKLRAGHSATQKGIIDLAAEAPRVEYADNLETDRSDEYIAGYKEGYASDPSVADDTLDRGGEFKEGYTEGRADKITASFTYR